MAKSTGPKEQVVSEEAQDDLFALGDTPAQADDIFPTNVTRFPAPDADGEDAGPPVIKDYRMSLGDRDFIIGPADIATISRIANLIGEFALRGQKATASVLQGLFTAVVDGKAQSALPMENTVYGLLTVMQPEDIQRVALVCLFGGSREQLKEGNDWFKVQNAREPETFPLDVLEQLPIMLAWRIEQSERLAKFLGNFGVVRQAMGHWMNRLQQDFSTQ